MLRPRIIPVLLIHNGGLTKTVKFKPGKYVGDPLNAVRIFNEKEVDEIMVIDIDATVKNKKPDYALIKNLAVECRMPLCYGGGVKSAEEVCRIVELGVEKVAISSAAIENLDLVTETARQVGSQSMVVVMDVKKKGLFGGHYEVYTNNGTKATGLDAAKFSKIAENSGAGEIVINSIDSDGTMEGYDFALIDSIRKETTVPITAVGGAGSLEDISRLVERYGIIGAAAGSLFVFKGVYKAVLISYPDRGQKDGLVGNSSDSSEVKKIRS